MRYYYEYNIYEIDGVEYTLLKWIEGSTYGPTFKIDKPTIELTADDLSMLNNFNADKRTIIKKSSIPLLEDKNEPLTNM